MRSRVSDTEQGGPSKHCSCAARARAPQPKTSGRSSPAIPRPRGCQVRGGGGGGGRAGYHSRSRERNPKPEATVRRRPPLWPHSGHPFPKQAHIDSSHERTSSRQVPGPEGLPPPSPSSARRGVCPAAPLRAPHQPGLHPASRLALAGRPPARRDCLPASEDVWSPCLCSPRKLCHPGYVQR